MSIQGFFRAWSWTQLLCKRWEHEWVKGPFETFLNGVGRTSFYILRSVSIRCWHWLTWEGNVILGEAGLCSQGNIQKRVQLKMLTALPEVGSWVFHTWRRTWVTCHIATSQQIASWTHAGVLPNIHAKFCDFISCLYLKSDLLHHASILWGPGGGGIRCRSWFSCCPPLREVHPREWTLCAGRSRDQCLTVFVLSCSRRLPGPVPFGQLPAYSFFFSLANSSSTPTA